MPLKSWTLNRPSRTATHMDRQHGWRAPPWGERDSFQSRARTRCGQFAARSQRSQHSRFFLRSPGRSHPAFLAAWRWCLLILPCCLASQDHAWCAYYTLQHCYSLVMAGRAEDKLSWFWDGAQTRAACCSERAALINARYGSRLWYIMLMLSRAANKLSGFVMGTAHSDHWSSQAKYFTHVHLITQNWEKRSKKMYCITACKT